MAKVIYARLFDWLVWRINESSWEATQRRDSLTESLTDSLTGLTIQ